MCGGAPVNKQTALAAREIAPPNQAVGRVGCDRLARLDLNGNKSVAQIHEDVDFVAGRVAPEEKGRLAPAMNEGLGQLGRDVGFEDSAA